ncbi:MAG TPA: outer membrane beta-barrel protein [Bacteroidales bacterium]|nr:outer membrane beta-barrel protein [Bacteroidales bacterium]HQH14168.1 outer membrane beta-barrel protein [Bacteroidales bacterium]
MPDRNLNIDKLFKDYLKNYQTQAPEGAWERIQADLKKERRVAPIWLWRAAAALILLIMTFAAGYFLSQYQRDNTKLPIAEKHTPASIETPASKTEVRKVEKTYPVEQVTSTSEEKDKKQVDTHVKQPAVTTKEDVKSDPIPETILPEEDVALDLLPALDGKVSDELIEDMAETIKEPLYGEKEIFDRIEYDAHYIRDLLDQEEYTDVLAQKEKKSSSGNWGIGPRLAPVYSYRLLGSNASGESDKSYFNDVENSIMNFGAAISLSYSFNNKWSLKTGMYVSRIGQENKQVLAIVDEGRSGMFKLSTSSGAVFINPKKFESVMIQQQVSSKDTVSGGYLVNGSFIQNLDYFEVPIVMQYKVVDQRFAVNILGGLSPGILVNNRSYFESGKDKLQTGIVENVAQAVLNSLIGVGFDYAISKNVYLNMEPSFRYSISSISAGNDLRNHPYSISWLTGITYKFY